MFLHKGSVVVMFSVSLLQIVLGLPEEITVGCLLHSLDEETNINDKAFFHAVEVVNEKQILPNTQLKAISGKIKPDDSFHVGSKLCELLEKGVGGVFGPQSSLSSDFVQSICDAMEIPHIEMRFDSQQRRGSCLVNLYPHPSQMSKVLKDLVKMNQWKSFTIIYEDNDGLLRLNNLLKYYDKKGYPVTVRQLSADENNRPLLRRIKGAGAKNIVLDCKTSRLFTVLEQALQVGLMGDDINYIITDLDMQTVDLEPFMHGGTNITGIRMIDPEDEDVKSLIENWQECSKNSECEPVISDISLLQLETMLIFDAVSLYAEALSHLEQTQMEIKSLNCTGETSWEHGYSIINYMKVTELKGLSGIIKFDHQGFRTNFKLDIIELTRDGLKKKGTWNTTEGVNLTLNPSSNEALSDKFDLRNMTFTVLLALTHPYGMLKQASSKLSGNDRFEGFGIDLIHELSLKCGFNYTFEIQADGSSGNPDPKTGKWSGMIGAVLDGKADLAIADITITRQREQDADFTMPFMNLGISILYKKPMKAPPDLFSFLSPFSGEVWIYVIAAYIGVSLLLFVMARLSPYEWTNPYPCIEEPDVLENQFSLNNSLWFTIGSLMQQGSEIAPMISPNEWTNPYPCIDEDSLENLENQFSLNNSFWFTTGSVLQQGSEIAPIAVSTRMAAGIWWFFTLIMVSSYTANLAAFLTIESTISAFRNIDDLANQNIIKYGAKRGGSTANFFKDSNHPTYHKMWEYMDSNPDVMTSSNNEGVQKVIDEDYAFLMESTSIEYEVERKCELTQVGGLLDSKGYGIVMRKNTWYRNQLSTSVISLQETGKLTKLKNKWWKEKRGGGKCQTKDEGGGGADELGLQNVGGVFVVLVAGVLVASLVAFGELLYSVCTKEDRGPLKEELLNELKFIISCSGSTKPLKSQEEEEEETNEVTSEMAPFTPYKSFDSETKQPL